MPAPATRDEPTRRLTLAQAINQTLRDAMDTQPVAFAGGRYVYFVLIVAEQKAWEALVGWLDSKGMAADLVDPDYADVAYRQQHFGHIQDVVECFFLGSDADRARKAIQEAVSRFQTLDAPYELAMTRVLLAQARRESGDEEGAATAFATASEAFARLVRAAGRRESHDAYAAKKSNPQLAVQDDEAVASCRKACGTDGRVGAEAIECGLKLTRKYHDETGTPERYRLPRPMIGAGLDFSFSGLKTAVLSLVKNERPDPADIARAFVDAIVEVLVAKCARAVENAGLTQLVVAGGVGANAQLRSALDAEAARRGLPQAA